MSPEFPRAPARAASAIEPSVRWAEADALARPAMACMVAARFVPVSASGTGKTLILLRYCRSRMTARPPARKAWYSLIPSRYLIFMAWAPFTTSYHKGGGGPHAPPFRGSQLLDKDVPEIDRRGAVMVLEADVAFRGEIPDLAPRLGLPVENGLAVQLDLEPFPLERDLVVVPFARGLGRIDLGRLGVVGGSGRVDARARVVDLDLERVIDVVVAHRDRGHADEDPRVR